MEDNCDENNNSPNSRQIHVQGTDTFRKVALFGSLIASAIGSVLILLKPRPCTEIKLENAVYISLSVHMSIFLMLLVHYIHLGACFKTLGRLMYFFYAYLVTAMIVVQYYMLRA